VINQAIEATDLMQIQRLATLFDGITRSSPEGIAFKDRVEVMGWRQTVQERDLGIFDWTGNRPINAPK
jgi:enoyl-CoA hydratase